MYTAIIVDDEQKARDLMATLVEQFCPEIKVCGFASDVVEAVKLIQTEAPELVFLDIEMPGYSGFQLLDFFDEINFDIIFTTAYREYAIKAFEVSAVDYLLKPIQIKHLTRAVEKFKARKPKQNNDQRFRNMQENMNADLIIKKIAVPVADGLEFLNTEDIMYLSADRSYTNIVMKDGAQKVISKNLGEFVSNLNQPWFFKPHRSFLINLNMVAKYVKKDGGYIIMDNGDTVSISREKRDEFLLAYKKIR